MTDSVASSVLGGSPVLVAHRAGNHPERFAKAMAKADAIELDVHIFRSRIEVRHEKVLWPTARLWERWFLLPADTEVPRLGDILRQLDEHDPEALLLVDLKLFTTRAARRIRRALPEDRPIIVAARPWWVLRAFNDRPNTVALRSCNNKLQLWLVSRIPGLGHRTGAVVHERLLTSEAMERLVSKTPIVFSWAIPTVERGQELLNLGLKGLIVDDLHPQWLDDRTPPA